MPEQGGNTGAVAVKGSPAVAGNALPEVARDTRTPISPEKIFSITKPGCFVLVRGNPTTDYLGQVESADKHSIRLSKYVAFPANADGHRIALPQSSIPLTFDNLEDKDVVTGSKEIADIVGVSNAVAAMRSLGFRYDPAKYIAGEKARIEALRASAREEREMARATAHRVTLSDIGVALKSGARWAAQTVYFMTIGGFATQVWERYPGIELKKDEKEYMSFVATFMAFSLSGLFLMARSAAGDAGTALTPTAAKVLPNPILHFQAAPWLATNEILAVLAGLQLTYTGGRLVVGHFREAAQRAQEERELRQGTACES